LLNVIVVSASNNARGGVMLLKQGNLRLPKTTGIWNLPCEDTCPNKTEWCCKHCYSKKAERRFPAVRESRQKNYELTKSDKFFLMMGGEIASRQDDINAVRIHEGGDFYSQGYLDKWCKIAKEFPDIPFTAYTKSRLDYTRTPDNLIIFFSIDESTKPSTKEWYLRQDRRIAWTGMKRGGAYECQKEQGYGCLRCGYCYDTEKKGDVSFEKH